MFNPVRTPDAHRKAEHIRSEYVLAVSGVVEKRPQNMINQKLSTGKIEVMVDELQILNTSKTPPVQVNEETSESEELRLRYRYLDLRRPIFKATAAGGHFGRSEPEFTWERTNKAAELAEKAGVGAAAS